MRGRATLLGQKRDTLVQKFLRATGYKGVVVNTQTALATAKVLVKRYPLLEKYTLRIVYNDYKSNFKERLERDQSFTIHERNIQYLSSEACKVKNGLSPVIMNDVFQFGKNSAYELRSGNHLQRTNIQTVHFGSESIKTLGAKIWDLIPAEIKASKSLMIFKKKIKNWTPKSRPCRLCRIYISQVGFIN